jgi:hypothetical protein
MPQLIPDWLPWMQPAGRLIWAVALMIVGLAVLGYLFKRPKPDRAATWAECMAGAVGVFALMTLAYAVIPNEWIIFSDKYLQWDTTKFVFQSGQHIPVLDSIVHGIFGTHLNFPFNFDKHVVRDIIATVIYVAFFVGNLVVFALWQKRGTEQASQAEEKPRTSRFGRPLRRRTAVPTPVTVGASTNGGET